MDFNALKTRLSAFIRSERGQYILKWVQRILLVGILLWLFFQLTDIGWIEVWRSLPTAPLFYILFIFLFLSLPIFEVFIYRITWTYDMVKSFPVFLMKRVYNKDVLGYSGEVYFYLWARKFLKLEDKEILKIIKDNNIISSVASTLISLLLLGAFFFSGQIKILDWFANQNLVYIIGGAFLTIILAVVFVRFRHYVISMPMKTALTIFGIQNFRLILGQTINLLMYVVVIPDTPLYVWFTLISVEIILSRIPFLPNRDLIFTGMGIGLSQSLQVPQSELAALLLVKSVLNKIGNFAIFGLTTLFRKSEAIPTPEPEEAEEAPLGATELNPVSES